MYCNMCGKNNDAGYQFCGYCGAPLPTGTVQQPYSQSGVNLNGQTYQNHGTNLNGQMYPNQGVNLNGQIYPNQAYPQQAGTMQPQVFSPYSNVEMPLTRKEQRRRERELMRMPDPLREKYKSQYNMAKIIAIIVVVLMVALAIFFYAKNYEERERVKEIMGSDYYYYNW